MIYHCSWQACIDQMGMFVKNLTLVDPDLSRVVLLDNSPASFLMHPGNNRLLQVALTLCSN